MTPNLTRTLLPAIFMLLSLHSSVLTRAEEVSNPIDYACPKGCSCATLDMVTLDKVQVHCRVLNIAQDQLNFTVIQTNHTALLYLICDNIFQSTLSDHMFSHLTQMEQLYLEDCKIRRLFPGALWGTESLRILHVSVRSEARPNLTIEPKAFKYAPNLEEVDISAMGISQLPKRLFCGLNHLTHLNLSNNLLQQEEHLGYMNTAHEACMPALTQLDLSWNALHEINCSLQQYMPNLEVLYLQQNRLQHLGIHAFANYTKLALLDLSYNRLAFIDPNLFTGLTSLLILLLDHNRILCLPETVFTDTSDLYQVSLAHNNLTNECLPSLQHLSSLQKLDISHNNLSFIANQTFPGLYHLTEINLGSNNIKVLEICAFCNNSILQQLHLRNNFLSSFSVENIFGPTGSLHLQTLDLSSNKLKTEKLTLNFSSIPSITQLTLADNSLSEIPSGTAQLRNLTWLDLSQNTITEITKDCCINLPNLQYLVLRENLITYIPKKVFQHMPQLVAIDMSRNTIQRLEYECFDGLYSLAVINLKYNSIQDINGVFYKLPKLQVLLLDYNAINRVTSNDIPSSIVTLTLSHNLISTIYGYFLKFMPNLKLIDLTLNKITSVTNIALQSAVNPFIYLGGNYLFCNCHMQYLQTINDYPRLYAKVGDLQSILCYTVKPHQQFSFLVDLEPNDFLCDYSEVCPQYCDCCYDFPSCGCLDRCPSLCTCLKNLDSSYNRIECSGVNLTSIPDNIPYSASHVFLDNNNITIADNNPFVHHNFTKYLYFNASGVVHIEPGTFLGLNHLRVLHLENNNIETLQNGTFQGLINLEELYLQQNALSDIQPGAFAGLSKLKLLHLEDNLFETVNLTALDDLSASLEVLYLSGNDWLCDCTSGPVFQDWLISMYQTIKDDPSCGKLESGLRSNSSSHLITGVKFNSCFNETKQMFIDRPSKALIPVVTVMISLFILILISIMVVFRYRDIIQVWLYSRYGLRISKIQEDEDKDYDAFISYSSKDESFVVHELAPTLEEGDPPYRLCVHYRDWIIGRGIAESIGSSVHSSRRTIMLLSNNYIDSEWCNYEFQMAHHQVIADKTCRLIVILMENEPPANLDDELKLYIKTHTYIKRSDPWFWERLKYALPSVSQDDKEERWTAKAQEKEMLDRTRQAMKEFHIQGPQIYSQGEEQLSQM